MNNTVALTGVGRNGADDPKTNSHDSGAPGDRGARAGRPRAPVRKGEPGESYVTALRRWPDEIARITNDELARRISLRAGHVSSLLQNGRGWKVTPSLLDHALKIIEVCGGEPQDLENWTEYHYQVAAYRTAIRKPSLPTPPEPVRLATQPLAPEVPRGTVDPTAVHDLFEPEAVLPAYPLPSMLS
jgi:hypothetical protein